MKKLIVAIAIIGSAAIAFAANSTAPTVIFGANYLYATNGQAVTANSVVIPLAFLPGLTAAQATGDVRAVVYCLMTQVQSFTDTNMFTKMNSSSSALSFSGTNVVKTFTQGYILGNSVQQISE